MATPSSQDTLAEGAAELPKWVLAEGARVDRYVIRRRVGAGGMGIVYAAYDPELDRHVALKLLHSEHDTAQERLLREARAMARLSHPNVIAIHDVGLHEGRVYLAMELIDGPTLRTWLAVARPGWQEIVRVFAMAGEGLAAAHDKGLVHRDFKPENVMLDAEGRVRVMDFGLVQSSATPIADDCSDAVRTGASDALTQTGKTVGTPAYMAPEQYNGTGVDARTDQFSFSVALFEALHGVRPFVGDTPGALMLAVLEGDIRVPAESRVPTWLRRAVRRGLSVHPAHRWPSMRHLLAEIERGSVRARRRRRIVAIGSVAVLLGVGAWGRHAWVQQQTHADCEGLGREIDALWPGRASTVEAGIVASGVPEPAALVQRIQPWLDAWAESWRSTRTNACLAAPETMTASTRARIESCLGVLHLEAEAVVDGIEHADLHLANNAVFMVAVMQSPADCADETRLGRTAWPDPEQLDAVTRLRGRLARSHTLLRMGRLDDALAEADAVAPEVEALGWAPLRAETALRRGEARFELARFDDAEPFLREAYYTAGGSGADLTAAEAARLLAHVVGYGLARHAEGLEWGERGAMHLQRVGAEDSVEASGLANAIAGIHFDKGDLAKAQPHVERALQIQEKVFGRDHPELAPILHNLAGLHRAAGRYDEAGPLYRRAIALRERFLGPEDLGLITSYASLAAIQLERRELADAERLLRDAMRIVDARLPKDHADRALVLNSLAAVLRARGRLDDAVPMYEEAIGIVERTLGPEHPELGAAVNNLGNALSQRGEHARAVELHERAIAIWEKAYGPDHPHLAIALTSLGDTLMHAGRGDEAIAPLQRALTIREAAQTPPEDLAETRFFLAQALWTTTSDRERARALAQRAEHDFAALGPTREEQRREVQDWLAAATP